MTAHRVETGIATLGLITVVSVAVCAGVGISLVNRTVEVLRQVTGPLPFPRPCVCGDFHCGTCACGCSFYEPDDGQAGVPYTSSPVNPFFWSPKQEAYR
jgi:hypothetical protein